MSNATAPPATPARKQIVIENPILNSPFEEPKEHFRFDEDGITDQVVHERRLSSYFVPIPQARKRSKQQLQLDSEWTADRIEENTWINKLRAQVKLWRQGGYNPRPTTVTKSLLDYWQRPDRERRQTRPSSASPSRWPLAAARPSSWQCLSLGKPSTSSPTYRTPASPTHS